MSHSITKCTHEENRKKACAPCGKKILFGTKKPDNSLINAKHEKLIQDLYNSDFSLTDSKYPISICSTCRNTNLVHEKEIFKRPLQKMPNYGDMILPNVTRNNNCDCYICLTGRNNPGTVVIKKGRGYVRNLSNQIDQSNGLHGNSKNIINSLPKKQDLTKINKNYWKNCQKSNRNKLFLQLSNEKSLMLQKFWMLKTRIPLTVILVITFFLRGDQS